MPDNSDSADKAQDVAKGLEATEKHLGELLTATAEWVQGERNFRTGRGVTVFFVFPVMWMSFFHAHHQTTAFNSSAALPLVVFSTLTIGSAVFVYRIPTRRSAYLFYSVVTSLLNIIWGFTCTYYLIGTNDNFSAQLTHVDAIYFTVGTLTTAGTGSRSATSQLSRTLVSVQMIVDLIFLAVTVVIAIQKALAGTEMKPLPKRSVVNRWRTDAQDALRQLQSARRKLEEPTGDATPESTATIKSALADAQSALKLTSTVLSDCPQFWGTRESANEVERTKEVSPTAS